MAKEIDFETGLREMVKSGDISRDEADLLLEAEVYGIENSFDLPEDKTIVDPLGAIRDLTAEEIASSFKKTEVIDFANIAESLYGMKNFNITP